MFSLFSRCAYFQTIMQISKFLLPVVESVFARLKNKTKNFKFLEKINTHPNVLAQELKAHQKAIKMYIHSSNFAMQRTLLPSTVIRPFCLGCKYFQNDYFLNPLFIHACVHTNTEVLSVNVVLKRNFHTLTHTQ